MRRYISILVPGLLVAAAGFAAASIASGSSIPLGAATATTATTGTIPVAGGKVALCHRTGSKKRPYHTISVAPSAVPAHLRHGDKPGPCSAATIQETKKGRKHGDAQRNGKPTQDKRGQQPEDQAAESQPPADDSGQSQGEAGGERGRGRGHGKNRGGNEHKSGKK